MKILLPTIVSLSLLFTASLGCKPKSLDQPAYSSGPAEHLFKRSYKINTPVFVGNLQRLAAPKPGESNQQLLLRFFKENDVAVDPRAVLLDEVGNRLLVCAPDSEKAKVQALFDKINKGQ